MVWDMHQSALSLPLSYTQIFNCFSIICWKYYLFLLYVFVKSLAHICIALWLESLLLYLLYTNSMLSLLLYFYDKFWNQMILLPHLCSWQSLIILRSFAFHSVWTSWTACQILLKSLLGFFGWDYFESLDKFEEN